MEKKKKNTKKKGTDFEKWVETYLTDKGYTVHRSRRSYMRFGGFVRSATNDIFGCIDITAMKIGEPNLMIQCTVNPNITEKKKEIEALPWNLVHNKVEIWRKIDRGRISIERLLYPAPKSKWRKVGEIQGKVFYEAKQ